MAPIVLKQVVSVIDSRTTLICLHAAGQIQAVDDQFETLNGDYDRPPFHVHCRSVSVPWVPGMGNDIAAAANAELQRRPIGQRDPRLFQRRLPDAEPAVAPPAARVVKPADFKDALSSERYQGFRRVFQAEVEDAVSAHGLEVRLEEYDPEDVGAIRMFLVDPKNGREIGKVERVVETGRNGETWVHNALFTLAPEYQRQGIARSVTKVLEEWYRASGVTGVKVEANIDVGGYTWARMGFGWDPVRHNKITMDRFLDRLIDKRADVETVERMRAIVESSPMAEWPTPYDLAMVGWEEGSVSWPGKRAMLTTTWYGKKAL